MEGDGDLQEHLLGNAGRSSQETAKHKEQSIKRAVQKASVLIEGTHTFAHVGVSRWLGNFLNLQSCLQMASMAET
jgi:hypothetical protein